MFETSYQDHLAALTDRKKDRNAHDAPFDHERHAAASFDPRGGSDRNIDSTLKSIMESSKRPNKKQEEFLRHFVKRLKFEWLEKQQGKVNGNQNKEKQQGNANGNRKEEPVLDLVHGFPGTGKSAVIGWMRQLMEEGLGWEHGVQFVCLAFQNAMAAQINGHTQCTTGVAFLRGTTTGPPWATGTRRPSSALPCARSSSTRFWREERKVNASMYHRI